MASGDVAWVLVSAALVLLMVPGLALFYGGMVRRKNVLSTFMHSFAALPLISLQWMAVGYTLVFGESHGGVIGGLELAGLRGLTGTMHGSVPTLAFASFQMMFAVITPALISGAFAERMKFSAYALFAVSWSTLVYDPVAHWVWNEHGWLFRLSALDFAGGSVVHATAGIAALVVAKVIGPRLRYPQERPLPHDLTMTLTGAGLLWFGWFGFNAGSALGANAVAATAFVNTQLGASGGALAWILVEWRHRKKPTALGVASGLVAGLVAITPAAGFVEPWAATLLGMASGAACYGAVLVKYRLGYDDSLDAFGIHGVGGILGAVLTGLFATQAVNADGQNGLLYGNARQLGVQLIGLVVVCLYAAVVTYVLLLVVKRVTGLRVSDSDEKEGLDTTQHGEDGYAG